MLAADHVRDILMMELIGIQSKNPHFSMRAYSKKLGIPQSAISEIIRKKRKVTAKMALKILKGLDFAPPKIERVMDQFSTQEKSPIVGNGSFQSLNMDTFHLISEWYHFAILSLAETKSFKSDENWIAKRLGLSENQVKTAISRLLRLEMLEVDPKSKRFKPTGVQYQIDPGIATPALKKACRENLELSGAALDSSKFEERDFTAITICFDPDKMNEAKRMLKHFRQKFAQQMESGSKKEVYKLCLQLFPLTK